MPDSAADPVEAKAVEDAENAEAPADEAGPISGPELAAELSRARQHPRFLHRMSVPGQQELRTRIENPPPPKKPLLIFFLGVPLSILGVFIHTSVALISIFVVAIAFISALFRARAANMARIDGLTFEPAAAKVEGLDEGRALLCAFQPESPCGEWRGIPVSDEEGAARLRLPWDERMTAFKPGDLLVFVAHEGRVLSVEDVSPQG